MTLFVLPHKKEEHANNESDCMRLGKLQIVRLVVPIILPYPLRPPFLRKA